MMLQLVRRGQLLATIPRLRVFLPVLAPVFIAAISSSADSKSSSLLATGSLQARYSGLSTKDLIDQLAARNLKVGGKKSELVKRLASDDIFRARKLSTSSRHNRGGQIHAEATRKPHVDEVPDIPKPREIEAVAKTESPIRVPITPENQSAQFHRDEVVPKVAPPTKHEVSTDIPDVVDAAEDMLADVLEDISVEAKAHKAEEQYIKEHDEVKKPVNDAVRSVTSTVHEVMSNEDSLLRIVVRFPVEVAKDMMEDALSGAQQQAKLEVKQDRAKQQDEAKDEGPQELDSSQRRVLYMIGGLSAVWYLFGF